MDPTRVEKIITGTKMNSQEAWEDAIRRYRRDFWYSDPDRAEELLRQFLAEGKIVQPRLTEHRHPDSRKKIWVKSESEITYFSDPPEDFLISLPPYVRN